MISTLTKRRRYGQFGSTPSIQARWLPGFGSGGAVVVPFGRLEYTIPYGLMDYTIPRETLEFTIPKLPEFTVPEP